MPEGWVMALALCVQAVAGCLYLMQLQRDWALPYLAFFAAVLSMWTAHAIALFGLAHGVSSFQEMYTVDPVRYYAVYLPLLGAFGVGIAAGGFRAGTADWSALRHYLPQQPYSVLMLLAGGVLSYVLHPFMPAGLRLLTGLGVWSIFIVTPLYIQFAAPRIWATAGVLLAALAIVTNMLSSTMFGEGFFALLMLLCGFFLKNETPLWVRAAMLFASGVLVAVVLSFKFEYRETVPTNLNPVEKLEHFTGIAQNRLTGMLDNPGWHRALLRLDQGHLSGKVLAYVPEKTPFVHGETVRMALVATLIPRLFWPDKPTAGGSVIFPRFTGETLTPGLSKNIGQFAEAYANYGALGAIPCILVYGLLIRLLYEELLRLQSWYPPMLLWLPFVFFVLLSVEKDFLISINHMSRAVFFAIGACFLLKTVSNPIPVNQP